SAPPGMKISFWEGRSAPPLQAAGAGRWLTATGGEPATLGLERGLDFVELMGGHDPRVTLHVRAARLMAEARTR
ncbi:hypothetical protein I3W98_26440, partial [Streptomyces cavourensis]|nr:hypothetical protein [Streptomyces cavourensis]